MYRARYYGKEDGDQAANWFCGERSRAACSRGINGSPRMVYALMLSIFIVEFCPATALRFVSATTGSVSRWIYN